jgi:hypothetical protein
LRPKTADFPTLQTFSSPPSRKMNFESSFTTHFGQQALDS